MIAFVVIFGLFSGAVAWATYLATRADTSGAVAWTLLAVVLVALMLVAHHLMVYPALTWVR